MTLSNDRPELREQWRLRAQDDPDFKRLMETAEWVFSRLAELWGPIARETIAHLSELFDTATDGDLNALAASTGAPAESRSAQPLAPPASPTLRRCAEGLRLIIEQRDSRRGSR
jgi:hypothetical protein